MRPGLAAASCALMLLCQKYRLIDQRPSSAIRSFDYEIKSFHLESQAWQKYWTGQPRGLSCVIHLMCPLRKNSKKPLWSLCKNWRTRRRNSDMLSDTSRWASSFLHMSFKYAVDTLSTLEGVVCMDSLRQRNSMLHSTPRKQQWRRARGFSPGWSAP